MRKRGLYWQARPKAGDKLGKWRSTRCTDLKAAQAVLADWERELADPAYRAAQGATLAQAVDRVNRDFQQLVRVGKRSQATADYYLEKSGVLLSVLGANAPLASVTARAVDSLIDVRRNEGVTEHTIAKELGVLRVLLKAAKRAGWWVGDLDSVLPHAFGTQAKPRERFLSSLAELGKILRAIYSPDIAAQVAFSVATGAESQAIKRAQWTDLSERYVAIHGKKRPTRERMVPIVASWQETLILFVRNHAMGDRTTPQLFRHVHGIPKALREACKELGIPHVCPNDLRRTFNVWMDAAGVPVGLRAQAMGHASTRLLDKFTYGKLSPDMLRDRMRETFDGRGNRGERRGSVATDAGRRRDHGDHGVRDLGGQEVQGGAGARYVAEPGRDAGPVGEGEGDAADPVSVLSCSVLCRSGVTDAGGEDRTEPHISSPANCDSPRKEAPRAGIEPATYGLTVPASTEGKPGSLSK